MSFIEIIITSVGLAMDAFATSICKGLSLKNISFKKCITIGLYFGFFQGLMPLIGYLFGNTFGNLLVKIDHWIAFILLGIIGVSMLRDAILCESKQVKDDISLKAMIPLSIATSIDALAVGVTFAFLKVNIVFSVFIIAIITFVLSFIGAIIGNRFGTKYETKAQILGGMILIFMGIKILLEHLNIF